MHSQDTHKVIVIIGPTAIGKSSMANSINEEIDSIIVSADSRQVYKELTIGTAKPSVIEVQENNIKLVNHISIHEDYSAGRFVEEASVLIKDEISHGRTPLVCGGTGLYVKSLFDGIDAFPTVDKSVSEKLEIDLKNNGIDVLAEELKLKDSKYFESIDTSNHRRIIRALSVIRTSGSTFSSFLNKQTNENFYHPVYVILNEERTIVYERINSRVEEMFDKGLLKEVEGLVEFKENRALHTVGYTEVFKYLEGKFSLAECKEEIKKNTRRYAKRQMTWNRNQVHGKYFNPNDLLSIRNYLESALK